MGQPETKDTKGSPILRTLAMPADTNPNGDVFGGWIMSQMDIAGGILAKETARSRVVTVAVDSFKFLKPVKVGDVVCCYGRVLRIGTTSIAIELEVWVKHVLPETEEEWPRFKVTEAIFTYVAIDGKGKSGQSRLRPRHESERPRAIELKKTHRQPFSSRSSS